MSTTPSPATTTKTTSALTHLQKVAQIVELAGAAACAVGIFLSAHHYVIGAFFLGGAVTFAIGWKLRH
jgi:hypothetical protein